MRYKVFISRDYLVSYLLRDVIVLVLVRVDWVGIELGRISVGIFYLDGIKFELMVFI